MPRRKEPSRRRSLCRTSEGGLPRRSQDPRATEFSLSNYLPDVTRNRDASFRIVGSGYTEKYAAAIKSAKTVGDPTVACTGCHVLTTQTTGRRFAADAAGHEPFVATPNWPQTLELLSESQTHASLAAHRTDWALSSGIHPWMRPIYGNDLSTGQPAMSDADWKLLSNCLWDAGGAECGYRPLYTACPAPNPGRTATLTAPQT